MTEAESAMQAVCGLYCGACYHYRASFPDGAHLLTDEARGGRPLEGFTCLGCRSDRHYIHPHCVDCDLRDCADARGLLHCGLCDDFSCEKLQAFQFDGRKHHRDIVANLTRLRDVGLERWLDEQAERWRCTCGQPFSWYEQVCAKCGAALVSYGADVLVGGDA